MSVIQNSNPEFLSLALIHILAVTSPGPDFAIVLRQSISHGKNSGLWTSLGIGCAVIVHVGYSILGLGAIIASSVLAFTIIKYVCAFYLMYLGFTALRAKAPTLADADVTHDIGKAVSKRDSFRVGFLTNVLNPKATIFFLAVFSVTISPETMVSTKVLYGAWMAFATTLWFSSVSLIFSKNAVRKMFLKAGHWFEKALGAVLIALGARLICFTQAGRG
jgi:RhtB (resistance to homoserine/threonine) family protein